MINKELLKEIRRVLQLNQADFAKRLDLSTSMIGFMERGEKEISTGTEAKIKILLQNNNYKVVGDNIERLEDLPRVNLTLKNEAADVGDVIGEYRNQNNEFEELENGLIRMRTKLVTVRASAGYLAGWGDEEYIQDLPTHEVYVTKYHKGVYRSFEIMGDSMNDGSIKSIPNGSIVTGRMISRQLWDSKLHLANYQRYVIVSYEDGIVVKEIIEHDVKSQTITCRSLNPDKERFPDFNMDMRKVMQIFNVVQVTLIDK